MWRALRDAIFDDDSGRGDDSARELERTVAYAQYLRGGAALRYRVGDQFVGRIVRARATPTGSSRRRWRFEFEFEMADDFDTLSEFSQEIIAEE